MTPVPFRADPRVPVLALVTETDVITAGYAGARRPDGPNLRVWELAGASHAGGWSSIPYRSGFDALSPPGAGPSE